MNDVSLKAKINNLSKISGTSPQATLQIYLMTRFLKRISLSNYKNVFVVKGGMLISSIVGIDQRTTMDIDITVIDYPLKNKTIENALIEISKIITNDEIVFEYLDINPIRKDDEYGGYRANFHVKFGRINVPFYIDISSGDTITPGASPHIFRDIIDREDSFVLNSYPIETILAEKIESILSKSVDNTRARDFYDIYTLSLFDYDRRILNEALINTCKHRNTIKQLENSKQILEMIERNKEINVVWNNYVNKFNYACGIKLSEVINIIFEMISNQN